MTTIDHCCSAMENAVTDPTIPVDFIRKYREYGVRVLDGGSSHLRITFCPWCGQRLPESLRDAWFDGLERLGIDPYGDEVPIEYTDDRWYSGT